MTTNVVRPIVLVGAEEDDHVAALRDALRARGTEPVVLDALRFPRQTRIAMGSRLEDVLAGGTPLGRPAAVYLRGLYTSPIAFMVDVDKEMQENWRTTLTVFREKGEFFMGLLRRWDALGVPIYNSLDASEQTRKPYQLARLAAAGLPTPDTLWTNDPEAARAFARGRRVAYKPISGGAATKELGEHDLTDERLGRLANCPVTFQELLPGGDLRIFVLDDRVLAAFRIEVTAGAIDYRQNEQRIERIAIEPGLADIARRATREIGLRFTGMDLKQAADGSWRILELNPSPMFLGFDQRAGTEILGALADTLIGHARPDMTRPSAP